MTGEIPKVGQDQAAVPFAQEIEYALTLQRMINTVNHDPAQMRMAIYGLARARMDADTARLDSSERERLLNSLETAIQGVENFSQRRGSGIERLSAPSPDARIGLSHPSPAVTLLEPIDARPRDNPVASEGQPISEIQVVEVRRGSSLLLILSIAALFLSSAALGLVYFHERLAWLPGKFGLSWGLSAARVVAPPPPIAAPAPAAPKPPVPKPPGLPIPSDYGVYALNGDMLSELSLAMERAPDKRIAMSTPISEPSRTKLPDGKVRFILFRRDLVGNAPERIDVRVVARVARALKFDAKGKPNFTSVPDSWNIRNISYEMRVRPVPDNPEMLLVQSEKPDFELSPGRYVLILKEQPYDFTVEGKITDAAQCLERTDAMNGSFYSECQKP